MKTSYCFAIFGWVHLYFIVMRIAAIALTPGAPRPSEYVIVCGLCLLVVAMFLLSNRSAAKEREQERKEEREELIASSLREMVLRIIEDESRPGGRLHKRE